MKKPSKIRINILLIFIAAVVVAVVVAGLWAYGNHRDALEAQQREQDAAATPAPVTDTPPDADGGREGRAGCADAGSHG